MTKYTPTQKSIGLLQKYRAGECTPKETRQVDEWFDAFDGEQVPAHLTKQAVKDVKQIVMKNISGNRIIRFGIYPYLRVAAMLVIGISAVLLFRSYFNRESKPVISYTTISTGMGEKKTISLPDGSKISLNSASQVRFINNLGGKTREVFMEGEAFYEVQHEKRPFIVHSGKLNVQVLGTSFNIKAFSEEGQSKITVATGKVGVYGISGRPTIMLLPGDQLNFDLKNGKTIILKTNAADNYAWQHGVLLFKNQSLQEIGRSLERWFNIKILIKSDKLKKEQFNLKQANEPLSNVLKSLSMAGDGFHYKINGSEVTIW